MAKNNCWISVDPGLGGTGVAVWRLNPRKYTVQQALLKSFAIGSSEPDWMMRACAIAKAVITTLYYNEHYEPSKIYFELPAFMGGPTARRGDLVKLTMAAGVVVGAMQNIYHCEAIPVPVVEWKGQLKKELCNKRVQKIMGDFKPSFCPKPSTHELDAIGIGLHIMGIFV